MDTNVNTKVAKRLAIIEGHVKKIRKMLEADAYCPDVIHQSQAVQAALRKVDEIILHNHLHSCVLKDIHGTKPEREKLVTEIMGVFQKTQK
jgi:DNA-binding FrmR family transcriptional regulator